MVIFAEPKPSLVGGGSGAELAVPRLSLTLCDCWQALVSPSVQGECNQESSGFPGVVESHLTVLFARLCLAHRSHTARTATVTA